MVECCYNTGTFNQTFSKMTNTLDVIDKAGKITTRTTNLPSYWPRIPRTAIRQANFRKESGIVKGLTLSGIRIPADYEFALMNAQIPDLPADSNHQISEFHYILITGATPSTNIGTLLINTNTEDIPDQSSMMTRITDLPKPGLRTQDFLTTLFTHAPMLIFAPIEERRRVADNIRACPSSRHDDLLKALDLSMYGHSLMHSVLVDSSGHQSALVSHALSEEEVSEFGEF